MCTRTLCNGSYASGILILVYINLFKFDFETSIFAYVTHTLNRSWNQQVLSVEGNGSWSRKQRYPLMGARTQTWQASMDYETSIASGQPLILNTLLCLICIFLNLYLLTTSFFM